MTPEEVASIVDHRDEPELVALLRSADLEFENETFESALAASLRDAPDLVRRWKLWSGDQRWTPSASVDGVTTAWITTSGRSEHVRVHPDGAAAVADFIRRLAAWLARREVLAFKS